MLKYVGKNTDEVKRLLKESVVLLKWNHSNVENIILGKRCSDCNNKLLFGDKWYDKEQVVIFKRLCPACRKLFILSGYFPNYKTVKEYFINRFRMTNQKGDKEKGMMMEGAKKKEDDPTSYRFGEKQGCGMRCKNCGKTLIENKNFCSFKCKTEYYYDLKMIKAFDILMQKDVKAKNKAKSNERLKERGIY